MSTNYNILLKSEKKLKELILSYLLLAHEIHFKLWNDIDKYTEEDKIKILDNTERRLNRSKLMEDELLDECIWTISKDDPRANHLRFIIFIIYSAKDISRSCEYAKSIAKIIVRNNFDKLIVDSLKNIANFYLNYIEKSIKLYKKADNGKIDDFDDLNSEFESKYEEYQKNSRKLYKDNEIIGYQISQIYRLIFSTIERIQTIFTSFLLSSKTKTVTIEVSKKKVK